MAHGARRGGSERRISCPSFWRGRRIRRCQAAARAPTGEASRWCHTHTRCERRACAQTHQRQQFVRHGGATHQGEYRVRHFGGVGHSRRSQAAARAPTDEMASWVCHARTRHEKRAWRRHTWTRRAVDLRHHCAGRARQRRSACSTLTCTATLEGHACRSRARPQRKSSVMRRDRNFLLAGRAVRVVGGWRTRCCHRDALASSVLRDSHRPAAPLVT